LSRFRIPCIFEKTFPLFEVFKPGEGLKQLMKSQFFFNFKVQNREDTYLAFQGEHIYILTFEEKELVLSSKSRPPDKLPQMRQSQSGQPV